MIMGCQQNQRMRRELQQTHAELPDGIQIYKDPVDASRLIATLRGPLNSPYENGYFAIVISIPSTYPFHPPSIKFCTKVWHPNVSPETGRFCMDLLHHNWSPALCLEKVLLLVQSFLDSPLLTSPADAVNPEAAEMFSTNLTKFQETAREWTAQYATPAPPSQEGVAQWFTQSPAVEEAQARTGSPLFTTPISEVGHFINTGLDPPVEARDDPYAQVPPAIKVLTTATESPPVLLEALELLSVQPSWLARLLRGRTTPAFIALCEQKLIQQEDFSSAALLAMVPESDFTCAYLDKTGITAKGLQMKLIILHKELRALYQDTPTSTAVGLMHTVRATSVVPSMPNVLPVNGHYPQSALHSHVPVQHHDQSLDPNYVHVELDTDVNASDDSGDDP